MEKHVVSITARRGCGYDRTMGALLRRSIRAALAKENVNVPCEVSVLITDDDEIKRINLEFRSIDAPTDVLSFPMHETEAGNFDPEACEAEPETGRVMLGDIVISAERALAQSAEYGHPYQRELSYLAVHSVLHLLGYDHMDEADKTKMRDREKEIMESLGN